MICRVYPKGDLNLDYDTYESSRKELLAKSPDPPSRVLDLKGKRSCRRVVETDLECSMKVIL